MSEPRTFPLGAAVRVADLERDPYPMYARLQGEEPITWVAELGMWYVTRHAHVQAILLDTERFTTASPDSLIQETFGSHMLTSEGVQHDRYRNAVRHAFSPAFVRSRFETAIRAATDRLIDEMAGTNEVELRSAFASRLPIQTMLAAFGMAADAERVLRRWYDDFEGALANFTRDADVRARAAHSVAEFHAFLTEAMQYAAQRGDDGLLAMLVGAPADQRLSDDEIRRNLSIILFGGISTVEALVLNALWALFAHPETLARVRADNGLLPKVIDETIRWLSPVQSATRHVVCDTTFEGASFARGAIVNCMLGAANRDASVFTAPERFDIDRPNLQRHLGLAVGPHSCLGRNLARLEGRIALEHLLGRLTGLRLLGERSTAPQGYEFRQPRRLWVAWDR